MNELSDAEVMAPPPREMSDDEVMRPESKPPLDTGLGFAVGVPDSFRKLPQAFLDRFDEGAAARKREGGLLQAFPQFVDMMSEPEGRTKLWEAAKSYPLEFVKGMVEQTKVPGEVAKGNIDLGTEEGMDAALGLGSLVGLGRLNKLTLTGKTAGTALEAGEQMARIRRTPDGKIEEQSIGALPTAEDFKTSAEILGSDAAEPNLRALWEDRGIHPAEAVHDAQNDAWQRHEVTRPVIEAHHGSPHDFDRFDLSKIGIGEGSQSYGHGLYFAEHPEVAERYKQQLSGDPAHRAVDRYEPFDKDKPDGMIAARASDDALLGTISQDGDGFRALADGPAHTKLNDVAPTLEGAKKLIEDFALNNRGAGTTYRVRINADREHFLDWDKPLNEQSPEVQAIAKKFGVPLSDEHPSLAKPNAQGEFEPVTRTLTGRELYERIGIPLKDKAKASEVLREAGIPGIKYLDQGSRVDPFNEEFVKDAIERNRADLKLTKDPAEIQSIHDEIASLQDRLAKGFAPEKQTSNFVVFDHDLIEITHKNGVALRDMPMAEMLDAAQGGGLLDRARAAGAKAMLAADKIGLTDPDTAWLPTYEVGRLLAAGADVTRDMPSLAVQPPPRPGALMATARAVVDKLFDVARDGQMLVAPMARGTRDTMAIAKDFANAIRRNRWEWARIDNDITKRFTLEQQERMFNALDEESVARQRGESTEHQGLATLTPEERAAVLDMDSRQQLAWLHAVDLGMVEGDGIPMHAPRMVINIANAADKDQALSLDAIGRNLTVRTPQMRHRKYESVEETEAAAKRKFGDQAVVARNIRALALSTAKLEDAIVGRQLVDNIKDYGKRTGDETVAVGFEPTDSEHKWFTLPHPALQTWRHAVKDSAGNVVFEKVPIYIRGDFEGPLRATLSNGGNSAVYNELMSLKGKTMSLIMNSPLIHNAVEFGRAFPAMPIRIFKAYFDGNRAKNDPAVMREAIDSGLVPIGKRFFNQDINSIMEEPNLAPGRSWTSHVLGPAVGLIPQRGVPKPGQWLGDWLSTPAAIEKVKADVDKMGDFWHNTLLWDRVADLQMGLYVNLRGDLIGKGLDQQTASRVAAHLANRYAGALPKESMSQGATQISNMLMFSRTFTMGNLGVLKDAVTGLPKDVLAQIERDVGVVDPAAVGYAKSLAKRKAFATIVLDVGLLYVLNSIVQSGLNVMLTDSTLSEEGHGYVKRAKEAFNKIEAHPLEMSNYLDLAGNISSTSENEPGKQDRLKIGYAKDGTAIYARSPFGKIGEEFTGYMSGPIDMAKRKEGTIARPFFQVLANDKGFGRKVYDPDAHTPLEKAGVIWSIVEHFAKAQTPEGQINAFSDLVRGEGDAKVNALQALGPIGGVTFSKGAPGGPAVGEMYAARSRHQFAIDTALPDIRRQIQRGDIEGAQARMNELMIPPGLQRFYIRTSVNPATRLGGRTLRDFYNYATPEQRDRMERARQ